MILDLQNFNFNCILNNENNSNNNNNNSNNLSFITSVTAGCAGTAATTTNHQNWVFNNSKNNLINFHNKS